MKLLKVEQTQVGGISDWYWLRPDGKITVQRIQDADPIFNANTQQRNSYSSKSRHQRKEGLGDMTARIPFGLVEQYLQETGVNLMTCNAALFKRFLNDPNYSKVRTIHGKV